MHHPNVAYQRLSESRDIGTSAELSPGHFGTGAEICGHLGTSLMVPKSLGSEQSWSEVYTMAVYVTLQRMDPCSAIHLHSRY